MTCFTREEIWEHAAGFLIAGTWLILAAVAFGWALAVLARGLAEPSRRGRRVRRRRAPLRALAHPDHNPDLDGVLSPPDPDKETP